MDLTTLTDDQLDAHYVAVMTEREHRERLAHILEQVAALVGRYIEDGGDIETIRPLIPEPTT